MLGGNEARMKVDASCPRSLDSTEVISWLGKRLPLRPSAEHECTEGSPSFVVQCETPDDRPVIIEQ